MTGAWNSWHVGDFNYDAGTQFEAALKSGQQLSPGDIKKIQDLVVEPTTAGFFNIPVCAVYDLRYFPVAGNGNRESLFLHYARMLLRSPDLPILSSYILEANPVCFTSGLQLVHERPHRGRNAGLKEHLQTRC